MDKHQGLAIPWANILIVMDDPIHLDKLCPAEHGALVLKASALALAQLA
jgi:hypothetical protein